MRSKYNNIKTKVDGILFDSKKEAARYVELKMLFKNKKIFDLELQPKFPLIVNGHKICKYIADFKYSQNGKEIIEDVKGIKTAPYRLKKKLMRALYNIIINEI